MTTIPEKPYEMGYLPLSREDASLLLRLIQRRYEKARLILTSALHVVSKDTPVLLLEWRVIHRYDDMSHIYLNQDTFDLNTLIMV